MKKVRVGVIGVGYLGEFHAEKYSRMDNVELIGVVDTNRERAKEVAARLSTRAFNDYHEFFGRADAVSIAVPTESHFELGADCMNHGLDVLIEKPMTATLEQADELISIAESRRRVMQIGHLERFNPAVIALDDIVRNPMFIEAHRLGIFKNRSTDVSVVLDLMIHDIDIIMNIVKADIKTIQAAGAPVICEHADIANVRLEFTSGCVANVTASRISTKNQRKIRLFQKDAYVSVDFTTREITTIRRDESAACNDNLIPGMDIQQLSLSSADVLEDELLSFIQSVSTRQAPVVSGSAGRKALHVALSITDQINAAIKPYL